MSITPAQFVRRLYRQLEAGKGMRFSAEEMDMLVETGAIDAVSNYAADWVRRQSEERLSAARRDQASAPAEEHRSPRSGRHHVLTAEEARLRALELCQPKGRRARAGVTGEDPAGAMKRARNRTKARSSKR